MRHALATTPLVLAFLAAPAVVLAGTTVAGPPGSVRSSAAVASQGTPLPQETPAPERLARLERRMDRLEDELPEKAAGGALLFLFGAFCALWAQSTGRSAMLWFLAGLLFNVLTVLVVLHRNGRDAADPGFPAVVG